MAIGFSQNFGIDLRLFSTALSAYFNKNQISRPELMGLLGVGDNKAEALVTWLKYVGIRDNTKHELTDFGKTLIKFDPYFEEVFTQWLIHYKLASNLDAEIWYLLSNEFLPNQKQFAYNDVIDFIFSKGLLTKDEDHIKADVSIFLKSFVSEDALSKTEYLKIEGKINKIISKNHFYKNLSIDISPYLVAYVIYDQREKKSPNILTITIEELLTLYGNVGRVFSIDRIKLENLLKLLSSSQYHQLLNLSTTGGLDQVGLKYKGNPLEILEIYFNKGKNNETIQSYY